MARLSLFRVVVLCVLEFVGSAAAQITATGASVTLDGIDYFIDPYVAGNVSSDFIGDLSGVPSAFGFKPITVVSKKTAAAELTSLFTGWMQEDDVFQAGFTQGVFLKGLKKDTAKKVTILGGSATVVPLGGADLPSGPYFLDAETGSAYKAYRLYEDFSQAFLEPLLQKPDGSFQILSAGMATSGTVTVGVPSRLYYTKTKKQPLAGVRVGVKDIYDLSGVKASYGNRARYHLYPPNEVTAPAIQRLIDAGAIIVGLQTPSQFANGEDATADFVDYHCPYNPRGDGYNQPSSSSSGGGASMASYEWLDLAVGSDTGGSIRGPSENQGLFGNRPSHGLVSLDDVMPLSPVLDTAGFLTRDPYLWDDAQAAMYGDNYTSLAAEDSPNYPTTIYTFEFPTSGSSPANQMLIDFANNLATLVGGSVSALDLNSKWTATRPKGVNVTLDTLLDITYPILIAKDQISLLREPFYADYAAKYDGALPFVDPVPLARWAFADMYPDSVRDEAFNNKTIFMEWFNSEILVPHKKTCSSAIMLYPGSTGEASPRNVYLQPSGAPIGFSSGRISSFTEVPDVVFPLGDVSTPSTITNKTQLLPVTVDVLVAKGCDGVTARLAQQMSEKGYVAIPQVGNSLSGGHVFF